MIIQKNGSKIEIEAEGLEESDIKTLLTPDGKGMREKTEALNRILRQVRGCGTSVLLDNNEDL